MITKAEAYAGVKINRSNYSHAVLIGLIGVLVSIILDEWSWFARSGALITTIAIIVAAYDIDKEVEINVEGDDFDDLLEYVNYNERMSFYYPTTPGAMRLDDEEWEEDDADEPEEKIKEFVRAKGGPPKQFTKKEIVHNLKEQSRKTHIKMQLYIASAGTLISGFGDLIGKL